MSNITLLLIKNIYRYKKTDTICFKHGYLKYIWQKLRLRNSSLIVVQQLASK
jgi:hypothetical protein